VICAFVWASGVSPAIAGDKDPRATLDLTVRGLEGVGALQPFPAWAPYYSPWWGWTWSPAGPYPVSGYPLQFPLTAPPSTPSGYPPQVKPAGRLVILTRPIDVEVYVDGVLLQRQPNLSYEAVLLSGPHQLDIRKDSFKHFTYKVDVPAGGGLVLPIELEKQ